MTRQRATLEFLRELRRVPCKDCGGTFQPHQMDFDHRDPEDKSFGITWSRAMLAPRKRLLEDIAKCDIVCANCHALRTYALEARRKSQRRANGTLKNTPRRVAQRDREDRARDFLLALRDRPCLACGKTFPPFVMQFDHRDASAKKFLVCRTRLSSRNRILEEAAKCDIVCPNCHRDRTFRRRSTQAGVV
jgi:ssDNA-binding Zn-finger/Zn-ribbon topoisomerase 1